MLSLTVSAQGVLITHHFLGTGDDSVALRAFFLSQLFISLYPLMLLFVRLLLDSEANFLLSSELVKKGSIPGEVALR